MSGEQDAMTAPVAARAGWLTGALIGVPGAVIVLWCMRAQLLDAGRLTPATTAAMYSLYGAHATATAVALTRGARRLTLPRAVVAIGAGTAVAGTALCVAGMSRFAGPGQVSATDPGSIVASGVYRVSRNAQYTSYLIALTGLALARRSPSALAATTGLAALYRWWVPIEERHLEATFGPAYTRYRDRTPRWLGRPRTIATGD